MNAPHSSLTIRRARALAAATLLAAAVLFVTLPAAAETLVGASRVDITPEMPVALCGYSNPDKRISEGVHDRLYARALAFRAGPRRLVLVSCDLSGFQTVPVSIFRKDLLSRFGLQPAELILCGTHTHSAPMLISNPVYPHPNNFAYTEALKGKLREAVGKALDSAAPTRLGVGVGQSDVAVNRRLPLPPNQVVPGGDRVTMGRNPEGPVDRDVLVLKVSRPDGAPVAALFDYACHSRSLRGANRLVSGDIFGIAEQFVEGVVGHGAVSPAFAGASGDIDPWYVVPGFSEELGRTSETVRMGNSLGEEVARVFRSVNDLSAGGDIETRWEQLALPGKLPGASSSAVEAPTRYVDMSAARVGEIAFLGVDCEAFVEIGKAIRKDSPFRHTFILTNCNGGSGYLPNANAYTDGGYEVGLTGFAPQAAGIVVQNALKMLRSLRR